MWGAVPETCGKAIAESGWQKLQGDDDILHGVEEQFHTVGGDIVCRDP